MLSALLLPIRALLLLLLMLPLGGSGVPARPVAIRWLAPQVLADSMRVRPRPVLVKIYTTWCHYCQLQDLTTFRDKAVAKQLNAGYYAVALDAESREPIQLGNNTFTFQATGPTTGLHALALTLARNEQGQVAYPTTVLLDQNLRVRGRWVGLVKPAALLAALAKLDTAAAP